jgi:uncharacterized membrane protein YraQ (UPF0718 family)
MTAGDSRALGGAPEEVSSCAVPDGVEAVVQRPPASRSRWVVASALLFALVLVAALTWAKWWPYAHKLAHVLRTSAFAGHSILDHAGRAGARPSLVRAWDFTLAYGRAVWIALVAALVISAAIEALLPRRWLLRALAGRGREGSLRGGLAALPCMMCTCCSAPLTTTLRREGVPTSSALAYWIGNPTLNPVVIAFLLIVAPWQWALTRVLAGAVLVFGLTAVVARLAGPAREGRAELDLDAVPEFTLAGAPARFTRALGRLSLTLLPEYLVAVLVIGLLRGWLFPFDGSALHTGILALVVAAAVGTLIVIPTAGEIPILQGLQLTGVGAGVIGALLITLPAISLPSIAMVGRALSWRTTAAMALAVALTGLAAGGLLLLLWG